MSFKAHKPLLKSEIEIAGFKAKCKWRTIAEFALALYKIFHIQDEVK